MCLSYGEVIAIGGEWESWKESHNGDNSPESAYNFIDSECSDIYGDDEQYEIYALIGIMEES